MRPTDSLCLIAAALIGAQVQAGTALAQAASCSVPDRIGQGSAPHQDGPTRTSVIGGFTLAASWSPEYCHGNRSAAASMQCSGRNGRFGFILHGLWPEAASGPGPQWCAAGPRPSAADLRSNLCITPSPVLLEHEWAKHGSCMVKTPDAYFAAQRTIWARITWPDANSLSRRRDLTVGQFRQAFLTANPGWSADSVAVIVNGNGWLREVQLCFAANRKPAPCPRVRAGARDGQALKIWRGS